MCEGRVEFDIRVPVSDEGLVANVRDCLERGLPELRTKPAHARSLTVVANGPTARFAPMTGDTLAINGALSLFTERGLAPTFWAACDPQACVADFLKNPPVETVYLVASKCHPSVFNALKGRKVIVWHLDEFATWHLVEHRDAIMVAPSVTICAFELMQRLGYRDFETWGWDGCFIGGESHAAPQAFAGEPRTLLVKGQRYESTTTWALEAQDAWNRLKHLPIRINGGGLIGEIFDFQRAA